MPVAYRLLRPCSGTLYSVLILVHIVNFPLRMIEALSLHKILPWAAVSANAKSKKAARGYHG